MSEPTEKQKRYLALESLLVILHSAPKYGPEGGRSVKLSEDLTNKMIATIEAYIEEGFEYLLKGED